MPKTVVRHEHEHLYAEAPSSEPGRALTSAILRLWRAERAQAEAALRASGLSSLDLTALRYLVQGYRDGRDLSPKDLIVMLDSSSATVTNVVERLVSRSYVTRVQHPTDRRAHYLVPTEEAISRVDESLGASPWHDRPRHRRPHGVRGRSERRCDREDRRRARRADGDHLTQAPRDPASVDPTSVRWKFWNERDAVGPRWP